MTLRIVSRKCTMASVGYPPISEISFGTILEVVEADQASWKAQADARRELSGQGHVELWLEYLPADEEIEQLREAIRGFGVTVHGPFVDVNLSASGEEVAELSFKRTSAAIRIAEQLGARVFTLHAGKYAVYEGHKKAITRFADVLTRLMAESDLTIAVENVKVKDGGVSRTVVAKDTDLDLLLELVPSAFVTLDVAHAFQNGDVPTKMLRRLSGRIACVQLHDVRSDGHSHAALGSGLLPLQEILDEVIVSKPRFVTIETVGIGDTSSSWQRVSGDTLSG